LAEGFGKAVFGRGFWKGRFWQRVLGRPFLAEGFGKAVFGRGIRN